MKTLFLLVAIANVALFMWEYKTGAFVPISETSEQNSDFDQEQILLVSEIKNVPQTIKPAPVSEQSVTGNASTEAADKPALVPELLPAIAESIDKPVLEKLTAKDSNIIDANKIEERCYEVGPFANDKAYRAWVNRLKDIKSEIKPITRDEQIADNHLFNYLAAETELEPGDNKKMLKNHGIKDLWLLSSEDKGKISLGLFIKEESALTMNNKLLAKGISAEVKAKSQRYALIKGDDKLMARLDDLIKTNPQLSVKQITDGTQSCWPVLP